MPLRARHLTLLPRSGGQAAPFVPGSLPDRRRAREIGAASPPPPPLSRRKADASGPSPDTPTWACPAPSSTVPPRPEGIPATSRRTGVRSTGARPRPRALPCPGPEARLGPPRPRPRVPAPDSAVVLRVPPQPGVPPAPLPMVQRRAPDPAPGRQDRDAHRIPLPRRSLVLRRGVDSHRSGQPRPAPFVQAARQQRAWRRPTSTGSPRPGLRPAGPARARRARAAGVLRVHGAREGRDRARQRGADRGACSTRRPVPARQEAAGSRRSERAGPRRAGRCSSTWREQTGPHSQPRAVLRLLRAAERRSPADESAILGLLNFLAPPPTPASAPSACWGGLQLRGPSSRSAAASRCSSPTARRCARRSRSPCASSSTRPWRHAARRWNRGPAPRPTCVWRRRVTASRR